MNFLQLIGMGNTNRPQAGPVLATGINQPNGHVTAPVPRRFQMNLPQVQSPQNLNMMGNAQGQRWMENGAGQRYPMPQEPAQHPYTGGQVLPNNGHNRPVIAQPQYQAGPVPIQRRII